MMFRLRNSLTNCHVVRGSPCNSWVLGGVVVYRVLPIEKVSSMLGRFSVPMRGKSTYRSSRRLCCNCIIKGVN